MGAPDRIRRKAYPKGEKGGKLLLQPTGRTKRKRNKSVAVNARLNGGVTIAQEVVKVQINRRRPSGVREEKKIA